MAATRANLATADASLPVMQAAYDRAEKLGGRGSTQAEVVAARASLAEAEATPDATKSALEYA